MKMLYGDCDPSIAATAIERLVPEPIRPAMESLNLSESGFHATNKAYIACTRDRVISIDFQRQMLEHTRFDSVLTMETDHSPFLSRPDELVGHLVNLSTLTTRHNH